MRTSAERKHVLRWSASQPIRAKLGRDPAPVTTGDNNNTIIGPIMTFITCGTEGLVLTENRRTLILF